MIDDIDIICKLNIEKFPIFSDSNLRLPDNFPAT